VIQSILQKIRCFEGKYTLNDDTRYGEYNNLNVSGEAYVGEKLRWKIM
jgi:hypothetical protein